MTPLLHRRQERKVGDLLVCSIATLLAAVSMFIFPVFLLGRGGLNQGSQEVPRGSQAPATIVHLKLLLDDGPPAIEIITTAPVTPTISKLDGPPRLAIDLPNTNMSVSHKEVPVKGEEVSGVSLELSATNPPLVHVEVDLRKPMDYTWEGAGNRLLVRLRAVEAKKVTPVAAPVDAVDLGNVVPVDRLASGASITASSETTVLRLRRGGNFYVCPRTTVSVTRSRNGPDMMLAIGSGAVETHITLDNSADEVITPDFRILLRGPGEFDYAIRADSQGNTCVRTLPGNTSSAIIYELMGDGKFEFQPKDQIVLHGGRLSPEDTALHSASASGDDTILPVDCGCPPPPHGVLLASNGMEAGNPDADRSSTVLLNAPAPGVQIAELPASVRNQPHAEAQAILTFRPSPTLASFPLSTRRPPSPAMVLPPPLPEPVRHKKMFDGVRHFFAKIFG
jgi:hypothetical protein